MDARPTRRSLRLPAFDYTSHGAYFVTVVAQDRRTLFGDIDDGCLVPTAAGTMLEDWWHELSAKYDGVVALDEFVVMPNHVHGIIRIVNGDSTVGAVLRGRPTSVSLPTVLDWYKTMTTNAYIRGVREHGWPPFAKRVWQRGYYEHVVRDQADLNRIRQYIIDNPVRWSEDEEHPDVRA